MFNGGILWNLLIGLIVGLVARAIMPGTQKMGWIMTSLLGIAGSFVAYFIGRLLNLYPEGSAVGFIASVIGAIILMFVVGLISKKS